MGSPPWVGPSCPSLVPRQDPGVPPGETIHASARHRAVHGVCRAEGRQVGEDVRVIPSVGAVVPHQGSGSRHGSRIAWNESVVSSA